MVAAEARSNISITSEIYKYLYRVNCGYWKILQDHKVSLDIFYFILYMLKYSNFITANS